MVPPKRNSEQQFEPSFIEERRLQLEIFIQAIMKDATLSQDHHVVMFLSMPEASFENIRRESSSSSRRESSLPASWLSTLHDMLITWCHPN